MKRFASIIVTTIFIAGLAGCNKSADSGDSSDTVSESVFVGEVIYNGSTTAETFLTGLDGKAITAAEITRLAVKDSKMDGVLDQISFERAECDGFAYAFKPSVYFDKSANSEMFNEDVFIGEGVNSTEFTRVNVGDKFGGLTVKSARTVFSAVNMNDESYYEGSEIEFEGEITLTGVMHIPQVDDKYQNVYLDMEFSPDSTTKFPLSVIFFATDGKITRSTYCRGGYYTDIPTIYLGKFSDYDINFDGISQGESQAAEITVDNVKMVCGIQGDCGHVTADLVSVKKL
ncbi:MAG: hypothetical protein K2N06_11695 [Oscillospiraceae bacterium]|nr:hypothetical protein [Oscillospiraceae bacterium]